MRVESNLNLISKIVLTLVIGGILFYLMSSMVSYGEINADKECENVRVIIDKALVQCYALEGSYPSDIQYLTSYGVILDPYKYFYNYTWLGSNTKPGLDIKINNTGRSDFDDIK